MRKPAHLLLTSAAVVLTAAVGGAATDVRSQWYRKLDKPSWQPPGVAFGPSWTFFRAKKLVPAVVEVLLLGAFTVDLVRRGRQVDRAAGVALQPYAAWVTFATALTAELARRNRVPGRMNSDHSGVRDRRVDR